jgi:BirA family transcriptional regulator, biotin operon repressor / biotin---[acetyl-CoA-carboxylase] ligase
VHALKVAAMPVAAAFRTCLVERALPPGWTLRCFGSVGSTQDVARAADDGDRTIFLADHQTAGRGRRGRAWLAAPGSGLLLSVLFRSAGSPPTPRRYTTAVSLALADAIRELAPELEPRLKWPNDVMLGERKVAGVLAEADSSADHLRVIVGVGVNVDAERAELDAVGPTATSLRAATGRRVAREDLLVAFVRRLDGWLGRPPAEVYRAWEARLWGMGQRVRLADAEVDAEVVVLGVDAEGRLRVRLADGSERTTLAGELIL